MLYSAQLRPEGPLVIRYPRGRGVHLNWKKPFREIEKGRGRKVRDGEDLAIVTIGTAGILAAEAIDILEKENASIAHFDMRFLKPLVITSYSIHYTKLYETMHPNQFPWSSSMSLLPLKKDLAKEKSNVRRKVELPRIKKSGKTIKLLWKRAGKKIRKTRKRKKKLK